MIIRFLVLTFSLVTNVIHEAVVCCVAAGYV